MTTALPRVDRPDTQDDPEPAPTVDLSDAGVWVVEQVLARNEQHSVSLVRQRDRVAALKRTRAVGCQLAGALRREFEILERFAGEGLVVAAACGRTRNQEWLLLEYLSAGDLRSLTSSPPASWLPILQTPFRWLRQLHGRGWIHGDIKATNVMVTHAEKGCFIDLGSAAPIGSKPMGLTPDVAGRNPFRSDTVSLQSDLHGIGTLLYELCVGRLPPTDTLTRRQGLRAVGISGIGYELIDILMERPESVAGMSWVNSRLDAWSGESA